MVTSAATQIQQGAGHEYPSNNKYDLFIYFFLWGVYFCCSRNFRIYLPARF